MNIVKTEQPFLIEAKTISDFIRKRRVFHIISLTHLIVYA